ncbi:MAG TPA: hypothetical protein VF928_08285 [Usitatibacteraceae bacterium]
MAGVFTGDFLRQQGLTNSTVHVVPSRVGVIAGARAENVERHLARCLGQKWLEMRVEWRVLILVYADGMLGELIERSGKSTHYQ